MNEISVLVKYFWSLFHQDFDDGIKSLPLPFHYSKSSSNISHISHIIGLCSTLNTASLTYPAYLDRQAGDNTEEEIADSKHSAASSSKKENFLPNPQEENKETEQKDDNINEKRTKVSKFWWRVAYGKYSYF